MTSTDIASPDRLTGAAAATIGRPGQYGLGVARILLGWVFLWAFLDKVFGLGMTTPWERSWLSGASPTAGYLSSAKGAFGGLFQSMAGLAVIDWLWMLGLGGVGVAFVLGVALRPAAVAAVFVMGGIYLSMLPLANNPFLDQHLMYVVLCVAFALAGTGRFLGLGLAWSRIGWVRNRSWLW